MVGYNDRVFIGIDPGKSGGIAWYSDGRFNACKMPETAKDLYDFLSNFPNADTMIEKVHSSPGMGSVSAFTFGRVTGEIHMACIASSHRIEYILPRKWQSKVGLVQKGKKFGDKEKKKINKAKAQELFPNIKITHAIADALLIAFVCYQTNRQK